MKPDKKADDLLREKLNSYSSPVPAGLFDAMDKKRKKQQTASAFGWRVTAGISAMLLALGLGFVYWQMTSDAVSVSEIAIANSEQDRREDLIGNKQTQVIAQVQNELIEQENLTSIVDNDRGEKAFIDNTQQQTKLSNSSVLSSTKVVKSTAKKLNVNKQNTFIETSTGENRNSFDSEKSDEILKENSTLPLEDVSTDDESETIIAKKADAARSLLVSPLESKGLLMDRKYHAAMPKIKCGWEARKIYLYFDAITSLDMAFRRLSPNLADSETYAVLRNQTESVQGSTSLGFRASAVTKGGFAMRTGLIYNTIKESFLHVVYTEYTQTIVTEDEEGNVLSIDTVPYTVPEEYKFLNRHKLLDIPVIVGYEIDKDRYNIGLNAGAYINITASQEGRFLNPNSEIVDFSTNSSTRYDAFKANVGMSLYSSFSVNYKITPAIHFIFEPYGRYYMNSFTTNSNELNQNYFVAGMQFGLRMKM